MDGKSKLEGKMAERGMGYMGMKNTGYSTPTRTNGRGKPNRGRGFGSR